MAKLDVLIFSYNRPNMIKESIDSVLGQGYLCDIHIVDDGSDYDITSELQDYDLTIYRFPRIRATDRFSMNVNYVLGELDEISAVTYLCDDDILAPGWFESAMPYIDRYHVVCGWQYTTTSNDKIQALGIGSFIIRNSCRSRCGVAWAEGIDGHSFDVGYIQKTLFNHNDDDIFFLDAHAVTRRIHENALSSRLQRGIEESYGIME